MATNLALMRDLSEEFANELREAQAMLKCKLPDVMKLLRGEADDGDHKRRGL